MSGAGEGVARAPAVSVVVVTWNNAEVIGECLRSVFEQGVDEVEAIVCDNDSADATVAAVERGFPAVRLLRTGGNWGFAAAVNLGIRHARGERIMLLNPEAILRPGALRELLGALAANPRAGAVGPRLIEADGTIQPTAARRFPSPALALAQQVGARRLLEATGRGEALAPSLGDRVTPVPCLSGAALMVPRSVFAGVGVLDETMPMYLEDLDLSARIGRAGLDLLYVPAAVVVHDGAYSSSRSPRRDLLLAMARGQAPWMYRRRFHGAWSARAFAAAIGLGSLFRLALLTPLLWLARGRGGRRRLAAAAHGARVLLGWSVRSKAGFLADVHSAFDSPGPPDREGPPAQTRSKKAISSSR